MWKGRAAELKKAEATAARIYGRRLWLEIRLADERQLAEQARAAQDAARPGPRKGK